METSVCCAGGAACDWSAACARCQSGRGAFRDNPAHNRRNPSWRLKKRRLESRNSRCGDPASFSRPCCCFLATYESTPSVAHCVRTPRSAYGATSCGVSSGDDASSGSLRCHVHASVSVSFRPSSGRGRGCCSPRPHSPCSWGSRSTCSRCRLVASKE